MRKRDGQNRLYLTAKGLSRTTTPNFHKDFVFVVGDHEYPCTKYGACFISPKIASILYSDPTIDRMYIDINDDQYQFRLVERLMQGHSIELNGETSKYLCEISKIIENREIQGIIERMTDDMTPSTIVARIQYRIANSLKIDKEIAFAAKHFEDIPDDSLKKLDLSAFEEILAHEDFQIPTEDYLFKRLKNLGNNFNILISYIQSQYLSDATIQEFLESISVEDINGILWSSLCKRMLLGVHPNKNPQRHKKKNPSFSLEPTRQFKGIIDYLAKEYRGNQPKPIGPDFNNYVKITSSGDGYNSAYNVADFYWKDYWISNNQDGAWIKFDFLKRSVLLTGYTIKSDGNGAGHLLGWSIEGSNDNNAWVIIDSQSTNELNQNYVTKSFPCKAEESYRYIRLKQTAKNSSGMDSMMLSNIEFFGELEETE